MDFDRLDRILKQRGISRRKLALEVGINEHSMSTAFRRKSGLSSEDVLKIANYLGVSPYFLEGWNLKVNKTDEDRANVELYKDGKYQGEMWVSTSDTTPHQTISDFISMTINDEYQYRIATEKAVEMGLSPRLVNAAIRLNEAGQDKVADYAEDMFQIGHYQRQDNKQED